jgi:hypothetical protein
MSYIAQFNSDLQNTKNWKFKYQQEAISKLKLSSSSHHSIYEDFENWRNWIQYAGSQTPRRSSNTVGGFAWEATASAGQFFYYHLGRAANSDGFTKTSKAKEKWHVAARVRITAPTVFPMVSTQRLDVINFQSGYDAGPSLIAGMHATRSTSKWSFEGDTGSTLLSTKNLSNLWTTIELWCDTTNIFMQVTDTLGTESPQAYSDFGTVSNTLRGLDIYAAPSASPITLLYDKLLITTPLQIT